MPGLNDQTEGALEKNKWNSVQCWMIIDQLVLFVTHRPLEINGKLNVLSCNGRCSVVGQHLGQSLPEGALMFGIDGSLVVLQADSESGDTRSRALAGWRCEPVATIAFGVFPKEVGEALQPQLKNSLTPATRTCLTNQWEIVSTDKKTKKLGKQCLIYLDEYNYWKEN